MGEWIVALVVFAEFVAGVTVLVFCHGARHHDACRRCWRRGEERDGCCCVLQQLPPTHPDRIKDE
jgi:hypothetical protein